MHRHATFFSLTTRSAFPLTTRSATRLCCATLTLFACWLLRSVDCCAVEPNRIWVDVSGTHSMEARLVQVTDGNVLLLKQDGSQVAISIDLLSDADRDYVENLELPDAALSKTTAQSKTSTVMAETRSGLRFETQPEIHSTIEPLPVLMLPRADRIAAESSILSFSEARVFGPTPGQPPALVADPLPTSFGVLDCQIAIPSVDVNDTCSRPLPMITTGRSGARETVLVMSVSSKSYLPGLNSRNELIRFDGRNRSADVVLQHNETILLMDHHGASGRSLVLVGFNSLGQGGELAIATGWDMDRIRIHHRRAVSEGDGVSRLPRLRWARWVDREHVIAVIDQTLGLWNLVSGKQVFAINGIDPRGVPALSGGRRYVAVPYRDRVCLYSTETGKPLGQIATPGNVASVAFSPQGNRLAIVETRTVKIWDLPTAQPISEMSSRRSLGRDAPTWIDSDYVLASTGVLVSVSRRLPIWRYDLTGAQSVSVGRHLVMFRRHPTSQLSIVQVPHEAVNDAIHWIDRSPTKINRKRWSIPGRSKWTGTEWSDVEVELSAAPRIRR